MRVGRTYVYERDEHSHNVMVFVILAVICGVVGVVTLYGSVTHFNIYRDFKASFDKLIVYPSTPGLGYGSVFDPSNVGAVVHVNILQGDLLFQHNVYDPNFNIYVPGAVTLNRRVEYCQWREHVHETTQKTGNGKERVTRTYTYTKGWTSYPINSLLFDQPAAHHNPQRRPVSAGAVDITGIASNKGFSIPATFMNKLKAQTQTFIFTPQHLQGFLSSPAYINDKFFYTGNNGWFLSKYEPSTAEKAMKMAFEYAEGTLFDFQLGDLFSVCDAGDVRVALEGKVLQNGVSAIALQNADGSLTPFKSLQGNDIMLVQEGQFTADEMMKRELGDQFTTLIWLVVGFVVSGGLCALFVHLFMKEKKAPVANANTNTDANAKMD